MLVRRIIHNKMIFNLNMFLGHRKARGLTGLPLRLLRLLTVFICPIKYSSAGLLQIHQFVMKSSALTDTHTLDTSSNASEGCMCVIVFACVLAGGRACNSLVFLCFISADCERSYLPPLRSTLQPSAVPGTAAAVSDSYQTNLQQIPTPNSFLSEIRLHAAIMSSFHKLTIIFCSFK